MLTSTKTSVQSTVYLAIAVLHCTVLLLTVHLCLVADLTRWIRCGDVALMDVIACTCQNAVSVATTF